MLFLSHRGIGVFPLATCKYLFRYWNLYLFVGNTCFAPVFTADFVKSWP